MADTSFSHSCCCTGVAEYQWTCTELDDNGRRYIPSVRDRGGLTSATIAAELNVYHVGNLPENCRGEVTAIEYCYRYNISGEGEAVFNWTVLILDSGNFRITNIHVIQSHPNSEKCVSVSGGKPRSRCCDTKNVNGFNLPANFVFGVTESPWGNTHGATLLGFHDSLTQYQVDTAQLNIDVVTALSVGSVVPSTPVQRRGLRMLWFVIGKFDSELSSLSLLLI